MPLTKQQRADLERLARIGGYRLVPEAVVQDWLRRRSDPSSPDAYYLAEMDLASALQGKEGQ